jgi:hypothetical protein
MKKMLHKPIVVLGILSFFFLVTGCQKQKRILESEDVVEAKRTDAVLISGGQPISISGRPYQARVRIQNGTKISQGGGAILNSRWIITAAHLFDGASTPYQGQIWAGSTSVESTTFNGQVGTIDSVVIHPNWNGVLQDFYDIALVRISGSLNFDANCRTLYYMNPSYTNELSYQNVGNIATASGWGYTGSGGSEGQLRSVDMEILSKYSLKIPPYPAFPRSDKLIYTFSDNSTVKAIGEGDSGGPLTVNVPGLGDVLVGIASFSGWPDASNLPSAFTRVSEYASWIQNVTGIYRPTIQGPPYFCESATYSINNLPVGATVDWSVSPSGIVSLTTNGNTINIVKLTNGYFTLTASVNNIMSNPITLLQSNLSGTANISFLPYGEPCAGSEFILSANSIANAVSINWVARVGTQNVVLQPISDWSVEVPANTLYIDLTVTNSCGVQTTKRQLIRYSNCQ